MQYRRCIPRTVVFSQQMVDLQQKQAGAKEELDKQESMECEGVEESRTDQEREWTEMMLSEAREKHNE